MNLRPDDIANLIASIVLVVAVVFFIGVALGKV